MLKRPPQTIQSLTYNTRNQRTIEHQALAERESYSLTNVYTEAVCATLADSSEERDQPTTTLDLSDMSQIW